MMTHIGVQFGNSATTQSAVRANNAFNTRIDPGYYSQSSRLSFGMIPPATDVFFGSNRAAAKPVAEAKKPSMLNALKAMLH